MPEETAVADVETADRTEGLNDGKVDMTPDSETGADSSTDKTEAQGTSGQDEKTTDKGVSPEAGQEDKEIEEAAKSGNPIPYERFKQVYEGKKALKAEFESLKAEQQEAMELLNDPNVFRAVLQAKGITDPKVLEAKMKEAGFNEGEKKTEGDMYKHFAEGLDLTKQESWFKVMERMVKHFSKEAISPIERKLTEKDVKSYIETQETEAKKIAKDVYGLEYGTTGKDEGNINTAIGKMWKYLEKNPEDSRLGHVKILRLALADEGIKLGEQKGVKKEKERHQSLKQSAFEDDAQVGKDETPNSDWPVSKIMAWRRKYGK